ncbi:MAG: bifunctional DNA-formamidopyrimidine glycosylase/DNA-(apurinic or apyrimidinic site) lyase [Deltaproteobacteria bacterium]|nr:MAG: bifunctional DNA-formamidopyrimidine glycosylase/DNA-(apurinic or apyrimidinic site) lyase [Deltaproteobacteria bacterium]
MPELPEVETVRRELAPWLTGRRILRARRADAPPGPKYAHLERADGQRIEAVTRRGKFLVLPLSGGDELIIHLGMTGVVSPTPPADHVRVTLTLDGPAPEVVYFRDPRRFGRFLVALEGDRSALPTLAAIGPEPLAPEFTAAQLAAGLHGRAGVKATLLGQRAVAGLGNIYVDEALWRARIHPETAAADVSRGKIATLRDAIVDILTAAVEARGTTLSDYRTVGGEEGEYVGRLDAYGRDGQPCRRCGTTLVRRVVAQRGTHFCPRCQRRRA